MRAATVFAILLVIILFLFGLWWGRLEAPFRRTQPLVCYEITQDPPNIPVGLKTQFGGGQVTVLKPEFLCTPATKKLPKERQPQPVKVGDHLQCYKIEAAAPVNEQRILSNQIEKDKKVTIGKAIYLCEPTDKTLGESD
jgi:hypothetical protein